MDNGLILSDLHVGADTGCCLPSVHVSIDDTFIDHTAFGIQKESYDRLSQVCDEAGRVSFVILNGDICHGHNYKERGKYCWTTDMRAQAVVAAETLLDTVNAKKNAKWWLTTSSGYHGGSNPSADELLVKELQTRGIDAKLNTEWALNINDMRIHCTHQVGVSSSVYWATAIARELLMEELHTGTWGSFDYVIRSHCHYFYQVSDGGTVGIITPAFMGRDAYIAKKGLRFNPHIGAVMLKIPEHGHKHDYHVWKWHFSGDHLIPEDTL